MINPSIYSYIKTEEALFDTEEISVGSNWNWNFKNHVQMIFHLINDKFFTGENNWLRAFKNVMEPILNLSFWTEDIEVKDIVFFIENRKGRVLSFLIKKYHDEVYIKKNNLDTVIDEITEEDITYGGVLVQKGEKTLEVMPLPSVAFCDQTDVMGGAIGFKYSFSPDKLRQMSSKGWGDESNGATISLEELITLAQAEKDPAGQTGQKKNRTTSKNIEVYIVKGSLPEHYLKDNDNMEDWYNQVHIVAFYVGKKGERQGVTLYRRKESESSLKFHTSKKVYNRALGRGVGESLLTPQIWTNFLEIHKMKMLEAGSKILPWTDDDTFDTRNNLQDKENLEVSTVAEGRQFGLLPTINPAQIQMFESSINSFYEQAQLLGSAFDPIMGKEPPSGTTFRGQERNVAQGRGLHDRRRGQRAKFIEELYRDWIIPDMVKEITKGVEFLSTLTSDELNWVSERLAENYANQKNIEAVLNGEEPEDAETLKTIFLDEFNKKGEKHILKILEGELKGIEIKMGINVANKQKNLSAMTDKLLSIFQFVFSNPEGFKQVMQIPGMSSNFNDILEFSGMSSVDFAQLAKLPSAPQSQPPQPTQQAQPLQLNEPVQA